MTEYRVPTMNLWTDDNASMMEAFISSDLSSFSWGPSSAASTWTYAIFWQSSVDFSGASLLGWGDGYYKGEEDKGKRKMTPSSVSEQEHRKKVLRELNSLISGTASSSDDAVDEEALFNSSPVWVVGTERLMSSPCERARQAQFCSISITLKLDSVNATATGASNPIGNQQNSKSIQFENPSSSSLTENPNSKRSHRLQEESSGGGGDSDHSDLEASVSGRGGRSLTRGFMPSELCSGQSYKVQNLKMSNHHGSKLVEMDIDVKIIGWDAMIRIQCSKKNHPAAKLMGALKELDLDVNHASVSVVNDLMIQQATVKMGSRFYTQDQLRLALSSKFADSR
ncbi:unnamed protein product, partial [Vitis vinifera]